MTEPPTQLPLFVAEDDEPPAAVDARRLRPLQQSWSPEQLSRFFLLSATDLVEVRRCRGSHNRLGFALHLLLLRFLHVVVSFERVPEAIIQFVSLQLDCNPTALRS